MLTGYPGFSSAVVMQPLWGRPVGATRTEVLFGLRLFPPGLVWPAAQISHEPVVITVDGAEIALSDADPASNKSTTAVEPHK